MDPRKMKAVAEWLRDTVFTDEAIRPRPASEIKPPERLPAMLRTARTLESGSSLLLQSRESIFLKQGKLLAGYEDDYDYRGNVRCYYPTYQSLTDRELRGYFSWRTKLRKGDVRETSLSFAFLYIYELLNQIGVTDPMDGYHKLADFRDAYGRINDSVLPYLDRWIVDYVVYYGLDAALLAASPQVVRDRSVTVLEHIQEQPPDKIMEALKQLSPKWLARSKFYGAYQADMDAVTVQVLRRVSAHYAARCKKNMTEQYFGSLRQSDTRLFDTAVFCDPLKRRSYQYAVDEQCTYRCKDGYWSVRKRAAPPGSAGKLDALLKTIDSMMREACNYRHPVKPGTDTKWIVRIIQEEIQALLAEKAAAVEKKVTIDYAQLTQIRRDAEFTQEKLIVDEETEEPETESPALPEPDAAPEPAVSADIPLTPAEVRLLQCLLYGGDTGWVQSEGHMLSVLVDGVNEKLYDIFLDSVLDDTPRLIEDYIDDLKEMVHP